MSHRQPAMIRFDDLTFGYDRRPLFRHLDMGLQPGNVYGLLGMNGAGKTSLLKLMVGMLFPTSGTVRTLGREPARREPGLLGQVFVLPEELNLPGVTDREYLTMRAPFYGGFDRTAFERYAAEFDVPRGRRLTALSYGQKKKFLLSFGLASGATVLVLDEPTNGLDIPSKAQFRRHVAEALTDRRLFVISTHQVQDVAALIDPIVILHEGRVLFDRTVGEVASRVRMAHTATKPEGDPEYLLYSEPAVGGYRSLWREDSAGDGHVDMEMLFNMVVARPELARSLFDVSGEAA